MSQLFQNPRVAPKLRFLLLACSALFIAACIPNSSEDDAEVLASPVIAYSEPVGDSTGDHATLSVLSTGGPVTRFAVIPDFPEHATLDTATGRIEYEMPDTIWGAWEGWETYLVIAVGPGGADTAEVEIPVLGPVPEPQVSILALNIALRSTASGGLAKASALLLSKLVITLTSSVAADSILRDTVLASEAMGSLLSPVASQDQTILKSYLLKPLRSWTAEIKTIDVNDVVIHQGDASVNNLMIGETRPVTVNLTSRYRPRAAKLVLPDTLYSNDPNVQVKQALIIKRLVMTINGDTVRDTTGMPRFAPQPATHTLPVDYVRSDTTHVVGIYVYADGLGSWPSSRPVYGGTFTVANSGIVSVLQLPWVGPGSPSDPNSDPSNPGGQITPLTVQYGPASTVITYIPLPPNPLPRRGASQ